MNRWIALIFAAATLGCAAPSNDLMPLATGRSWKYEVPPPVGPTVATYTVSRAVPVAGREGFELTSSFGTSRMVWKEGILLTSQTAGAQFAPALPIFAPQRTTYRGVMTFRGRPVRVEALTIRRREKERVNLRTKSVLADVVDVRMDLSTKLTGSPTTYQLTTYFVPGTGIVQQDLVKFSGRQDTLIARLRLISSS
jgi:hypothetical protein